MTASRAPNIVLILADNLGWGELGCYGGGVLRGAPTPRIDALAAEGLRLTNFNVESDCVPTRSALMTGRHPIRTGALQSVPAGLPQGLTPWEITLGQLLQSQGYATAIHGKWHLGDRTGRYPHERGFDEWYGIPRTTNESLFTSTPGFDASVVPMPYVMEGLRGSAAKDVAIYDLEMRRKIDAQLIARSIDFMARQHTAGKPFFAYVPLTQLHYPTLPHHDFAGKTGAGDFADCMIEMDARVGQVIDFIDNSGLGDNTVFIFASDNGPEFRRPWRGTAGPWKAHCGCPSSSAGRGVCRRGCRTRLCTSPTSTARSRASQAQRYRLTAPSTASIKAISSAAKRRNPHAKALCITSKTSCAPPNGATGKCT